MQAPTQTRTPRAQQIKTAAMPGAGEVGRGAFACVPAWNLQEGCGGCSYCENIRKSSGPRSDQKIGSAPSLSCNLDLWPERRSCRHRKREG